LTSARNVIQDAGLREFIAGGVSILVASCDRDRKPVVARACGCIAGTDGLVTILVPGVRAQVLLDAVTVTGAVAVVFSEPATHRSIQIKADGASVLLADPGWDAVCDRYRRAFAGELERLGYSARMARRLVDDEAGQASGIRFTPAAIFDQTPGPRAGDPIEVAG